MKVMTANSHDIGCSRPSGWKSSVTGRRSTKERISQSDRFCVLQTFELNLGIAAAGRVELQGGNAIAALQRSLRDIRVLNTGAGQRNLRAPQDTLLQDES